MPPVFVTRGDVDRGFAEADLILEREYDLGRPTPAYMEPNVCVSQWDGNGKLTMSTRPCRAISGSTGTQAFFSGEP